MKDLMGMMKQAKAMQEKMAGLQEDIARITVTGQSGGGVVSVTLSGKGEMQALAIDPSLLKDDEKDIVEDLVIAAHNDAKAKLDVAIQEKTQELTAGLELPAGMKLPF
ncbi:YbaB/EbfC family nucleoid-associated protein [Aurantimonas sp. C2-6-R+9]|uniref:Nucleoid-associated protein ENH89_22870 n=2 Tax=root TaxID=1 RepID=A0A9C9NKT4_9HYPH|nr:MULTISPECIES: YbaB/EbfC family nucleoid-associated protein [Aurantimonas]HDZ71426.1 YbaB/EbfC family nucleoid-associated protein [Aurantimonas coralicida]MEC5292052.1 YbaB/EbfC family nucleoid-associated protein [Aurantimonas sp. C2-3-R2]MEC5382194.1 YbaB/EbfC family nucleoid-associated protein [Aurantimonas sp. C2-6-R+9]MEC5413130.1 YbaB/EbfC family nucleoid-associated protein [Aurantimonas sp. C2-4-R8]HEU03103.1 YbaB/EbfC family nucleoid-associated protein [Aurantimonas coralicida]